MTETPPRIAGYIYVDTVVASQYSVVYRYRQDSPARDVAVKVLADIGLGAAMRTQRDTEANAIARLENDPRIVSVITADVTNDGRHYIIMPFYRGPHLVELMEQGSLDVRKVLRVGVEIALAVEAVHGADLLHGDIKPANILLDRHGPHLTDFGLAGRLGADGTAEVIGMSLPWSPPEIAAGGNGSPASDVYSLGATLWNLLAGRPPFDVAGDNSHASIHRRIAQAPVPALGRPDVTSEFEALLREMMSKSPALRPTSEEVARDLAAIEATYGVPASASMPWHSADAMAGTVHKKPIRPPADHSGAVPTMLRRPGTRPPSGDTGAPLPGAAVIGQPLLPAAAQTRRRVAAAAPEVEPQDPPAPARTRAGWWVWAAAAVIGGAAVISGIVALGGSGHPTVTPTATTDDSSQSAVLGADVPPGVPQVTAKRLDAKTLQFTWTYTDSLPTDGFQWQSSDGTKSGIAKTPTVDVADPAGTQLCIEVKVVRLSGGNAAVDWSPEGCGK